MNEENPQLDYLRGILLNVQSGSISVNDAMEEIESLNVDCFGSSIEDATY